VRAGGIVANQVTRKRGKVYRNSDNEVEEQCGKYTTFIFIEVIILGDVFEHGPQRHRVLLQIIFVPTSLLHDLATQVSLSSQLRALKCHIYHIYRSMAATWQQDETAAGFCLGKVP
jgi:hypothetical protein